MLLPLRSVTVVTPLVVLTYVTVPTTRLPPGSRLMNRFHGLTVAMVALQFDCHCDFTCTGAGCADAGGEVEAAPVGCVVWAYFAEHRWQH